MSSKSVTAAPYLPDPNEVPASTVVTDSSCINRKSFPKGFVFGTGTSAYQHEGGATKGGRGQSTWDNFTLRNPGAIVDGSNGNVAVDMYSKYEEDIKMMKSMGFDAYRFSISWPRLLPGGRLCLGVNKEGIDFYNKIIDTLIANDLVPYVTLFHWDLPQSLEQEYGGFLSKNIVSDFQEFAELCFWAFGDRVKTWITLNEPWTYCVNGYVNYTFAPSKGLHEDDLKSLGLNLNSSTIEPGKNHIPHRTVGDLKLIMNRNQTNCSTGRNPAKDPYTVARNLLLAHAAAVQTYRDNFQHHQKGNIGITLVCQWFEPKTTTCKEDKAAAKRALDFMIGWFLEPVLAGKWPDNMINLIPPGNIVPFSCDESNLLKGSIDFLGLNYYTAMYAFNDPCPTAKIGYYKDQQVAFTTERDGKPIGPVVNLLDHHRYY